MIGHTTCICATEGFFLAEVEKKWKYLEGLIRNINLKVKKNNLYLFAFAVSQ